MFHMEEEHHEPPVPSDGIPVEVVDLTAAVGPFQSMLSDGHDAIDSDHSHLHTPRVDELSEGTLGGWDTSLVQHSVDTKIDKAVSKRDYESLLMTARISALEDDQLKLPWESGVFKAIFSDEPTISLLPTQVLSVPSDVLAVPPNEGASSSDVAPPEPKQLAWMSRDVALPIHSCAVKVLPDRDFFQELDMLWYRAVDKWLRIFEILGYPGLLGDSILIELSQADGGNSREMVRDSMGIKSPRTAIKRAQTILKFFLWMQSSFDDWKPWDPERCVAYMRAGNSKGPVASRGISLLEAFRFCKFVLRIPIPDDLLSNPRVKGCADRLSAEQGEYHPARSLTATEVASLEKMMLKEMNHVDKYMLGAVLFCLYSRSRWSDVKHIHQLWIEEGSHEGELFGFIEGTTQHHKCATSVVKKRQFMPLVCPLLGITGCNWVESWMLSWSELGIDIDKQPFGALCRAASPAGDLCKRACTSEEISVFINAILKSTDPASSHSLKHTTLEWCSAYGIDEDARKLLGHHSLSGGKALAVYSRDLLNRPLQLYCSMLRNIRLDHFRPDESRTSRLIDALKLQAGVAGSAEQEVARQATESVEVPTTTEEAQCSEAGDESANGDSSSSSSSSTSDDEGGDDQHDFERHDWITGRVWRNKRSKVVHKTARSPALTFCGRTVDVARFELLDDGCSTLFARCSLCFRGEVIRGPEGHVRCFGFTVKFRIRISSFPKGGFAMSSEKEGW